MLRQAQHERFWGEHALFSHPDTPARGVASVSVEVRSSSRHRIGLHYRVVSAQMLVVPEWTGGPTDGLWRSTCFELFVGSSSGPEYREFNFAPHNGWAAYAFDDYRSGMMPIALDRSPTMVDGRDENRAVSFPDVFEFWAYVDRDSWPRDWTAVGLSAVIEEAGGTRSYWALAHPPGAPDFHHDACFALQLPALGGP